MKRVTGIGGIFFKAKDPAAPGAWYKEHLGIDVQEWGGAARPAADVRRMEDATDMTTGSPVIPARTISTALAGIWCALMAFLMSASGLAQDRVGESYEGNPLAIVDVSVIDVAAGTTVPHQTVVLRHGKIDHIRPAAEFKTPGWMTEIDGQGCFLIPGLWDVHVHLSFWDEPEADDTSPAHGPDPNAYREVLGRFAGWGVTSVRDMGGDLEAIDHWREEIDNGEVIGPGVMRAGPYIDGPKPNDKYRMFVTSADEARKAVELLGSKGVDFTRSTPRCRRRRSPGSPLRPGNSRYRLRATFRMEPRSMS